MDALIQLIQTTEEIEFMNPNEMDLTAKVELFAYIALPLCIMLLYWSMQSDEDEDENNKTSKR